MTSCVDAQWALASDSVICCGQVERVNSRLPKAELDSFGRRYLRFLNILYTCIRANILDNMNDVYVTFLSIVQQRLATLQLDNSARRHSQCHFCETTHFFDA